MPGQTSAVIEKKLELRSKALAANSSELSHLEVPVGKREHYGNRAEKLVEFGLRPFRSQPRVRLVGPDGKPVKRGALPPEPPANE